MKDLLTCIATRSKPVADIEQGYISSASCILANLSMKLGRSLTWDPQAGKVVGDDEANRLLAAVPRALGPSRPKADLNRGSIAPGSGGSVCRFLQPACPHARDL